MERKNQNFLAYVQGFTVGILLGLLILALLKGSF